MFLFSVSFYLLLLHVTAAIDPWDLPVFPPEMASRTEDIPDEEQVSKRYQIPRHVWISVKETPLIVPTHLTNMMSREKPFNWSFHLVNNEQATEFMETHFANTSTLWAFHQLSSYIGPAIADLWRYCILYVKGGFYMDHDVIWPSHLDDLIASPATQIVIAKEQNAYKNICYNDTSSLNDRSLARYYNVSLPTIKSIMEGRVIVNWALSSAPKHIFLYKAIENSVQLIRLEYLRQSVLLVNHWEPRWKEVMCVTGPVMLTASIRQAILEYRRNQHSDEKNNDKYDKLSAPYVIVEKRDFLSYGVSFMSDNQMTDKPYGKNDNDSHVDKSLGHRHYTHEMEYYDRLLLKAYQFIPPQQLEGLLLSLDGGGLRGPQYYFISEGGVWRNFSNIQHVDHFGFSRLKRKVLDLQYYQSVPLGPSLLPDSTLSYSLIECKLIIIINRRNRHDYYVIYNSTRHAFQDWDTFVEADLDVKQGVALSEKYFFQIPEGELYKKQDHDKCGEKKRIKKW